MAKTPAHPMIQLRKLCLALPEAQEVEAWGEPTFRVRNKMFAMFADAHNHHGGGRHSVWCKAAPGEQELLMRAAPDRFFRPPYVGPSGWVGMWLDGNVDWIHVSQILEDAYRLVAPKRLLAELRGSAELATPARKAPAAKRGTGKATPKQATARKTATRKAAKRKNAPRASGQRKAGAEKAATRKAATRKTTARKRRQSGD